MISRFRSACIADIFRAPESQAGRTLSRTPTGIL